MQRGLAIASQTLASELSIKCERLQARLEPHAPAGANGAALHHPRFRRRRMLRMLGRRGGMSRTARLGIRAATPREEQPSRPARRPATVERAAAAHVTARAARSAAASRLAVLPLRLLLSHEGCHRGLRSRIHRAAHEDANLRMAVLGRIMDENLTGIRVVRAFGAEPHELDKYDEASEEAMELSDHIIETIMARP